MMSSNDQLSVREKEEFAVYERTIENGLLAFFEVGQAFLRIRENKLYRTQFKTFAAYCRGRWKWSDSRSRQYIRAAEVAANLKDGGNGTRVPIPTSEYQVRPLVGLTPGQQRQAWEIATEKAVDPSARQVGFSAYLVRCQSIPKVEVTSKPQESLSEEVEQTRLWQAVRREMNELKEAATRWFEQLPGLEAQQSGMQKLQSWINAFKKEFPSQSPGRYERKKTPEEIHAASSSHCRRETRIKEKDCNYA
jgi:hypothetical protein